MDPGGRHLDQTWLARVADDTARRAHPDPDLDDRRWTPVRVPGHWRADPGFATSDGPLLYRHHFATAAVADATRTWLTFDGVFYQADVWLDGSYLGDTEGYFAPHTFEISGQVDDRAEHLLAVEVACPPEERPGRRRNLTGAYQDPDAVGPGANPGGLWAPVRLTTTGPVRIGSLRVACTEATPQRAVLDLVANLDSDGSRRVEVTTTVGRSGTGDQVAASDETHTLAAGRNRVHWRIRVDRPALWWPRALGGQALHDLRVEVACDGLPSDATERTTGLRRVRMQRFVTTINGERLFLKGASVAPTGPLAAAVTPEQAAADVDLGVDANLDLLRVRGHVGHHALYARADRVGMLLWQDLPLQDHFDGARRQAVRQARAAVDLLSHHPSVALWCGHDGALADAAPPGRSVLRRSARQALPHVATTRLDRAVRRGIERSDPSRPVLGHDGALPHPAWATDSRLSPGWYDGEDLAATLARWPALARFVAGLSPQAVPPNADFAEPDQWPDLDWDRLVRDHGLQRALIERWAPPAGHGEFASWQKATQHHQAQVVARSVLELRRIKYRPAGGFCVRLLADTVPAISRSLVDHRRAPKEAYGALRGACAPVVVVTDELPPSLAAGSRVDIAVHVVSDLRTAVDDTEVTAALTWPGGRRTWRWGGSIAPDSCQLVGRVEATLPGDAPGGEMHLEVRLRWPEAPGSDHVVSVTTARLEAPSSGPNGSRGRTLRPRRAKGIR